MSNSIVQEPETQTSNTKPDAKQAPPAAGKGRARAFAIFFTILALAAAGGTLYWMHARQFESTDDAQVDAHLNSIGSRVDGTLAHVYFEENQMVRAGDLLADLDPRDFQNALDQAEAQLNQAHAMVVAQQPNVPIVAEQNLSNISTGEAEVSNSQAALSAAQRDLDSAKSRLVQAQANNDKAQSDLDRYKALIAKEEVSKQEYDGIASTAKAQAAAVAAAQSAVSSNEQIVNQKAAQLSQSKTRLNEYRRNAPQELAARKAAVASQQAGVRTSQTQLEKARLNLDYTKIIAPVSGILMKRSAEVGQHIAPGQQLFVIGQLDDIWITANFKETQLRNLRPKEPVMVHVDALNQDFAGYVEDIGGATGAITSVLPPENATGNYVKVVQRIPVRIRLNKNQTGLDRLRPGMSVEPEVRISE